MANILFGGKYAESFDDPMHIIFSDTNCYQDILLIIDYVRAISPRHQLISNGDLSGTRCHNSCGVR
jgi:hypothetical protein